MKKYLLPIVLLFFGACSVDDALDEQKTEINEMNVIVEDSGCEVITYNFGEVGQIEVTNDAEHLFVTIASTAEGFNLSNTKLHISSTESGFPTVGQGNLPPGQMDHQIDFEPNIESYTFKFPISDLSQCVYIASQSTFSNGVDSVTTWAGDHQVKYGKWAYLKYCIQDCVPACETVYTGPSDLFGSILYTEAKPIGSIDEIRKIFSNLILQTGEYWGTSAELGDFSRYSPSISALIEEFKSELGEPFDTYDFTTTYTYGSGDCSGTINLTITVIDDRDAQ